MFGVFGTRSTGGLANTALSTLKTGPCALNLPRFSDEIPPDIAAVGATGNAATKEENMIPTLTPSLADKEWNGDAMNEEGQRWAKQLMAVSPGAVESLLQDIYVDAMAYDWMVKNRKDETPEDSKGNFHSRESTIAGWVDCWGYTFNSLNAAAQYQPEEKAAATGATTA